MRKIWIPAFAGMTVQGIGGLFHQAVSLKAKILNHRGTEGREAGQRKSAGVFPIGNLIRMLFFIASQESSVVLSSVSSVPRW